jgi:hypothetical protein
MDSNKRMEVHGKEIQEFYADYVQGDPSFFG